MAKFDPRKNEETYKEWRYEKGALFEGVSSKNREFMLQYLDDMEIGANVSPVVKRGPRSYIRLRNLKSKIHSWAIIIQDEMGIDYISDVEHKEREFLLVINKLRDGEIYTRKRTGEVFTGIGTLIKAFKGMRALVSACPEKRRGSC
ncbi:MAG: hypothetical protein ACOCP4_07475 [Candidatus Woesearchaeota archaeon]